MESQAGDKETNFAKIEAFVKQAAQQGVQLLVFPECCISGYWFIRHLTRPQLEKLAEPIFDGPSSERLSQLARRYGLSIGAGLVEAVESGYFHNNLKNEALRVPEKISFTRPRLR